MEPGKILIVEDDPDLQEMLGAYFQVQGYETTVAGRGDEAMDALSNDLPDLVILDINLPDTTGYEICQKMREQKRTAATPVIFLTEKRQRVDRLAGLKLGAADYITKPFDIQELRLRVRNALRRARLGTMYNPVTGLSESSLVLERLEQMFDQPAWGLVHAGIRGLDKFRDRYGFIAADDVARAVTLMLGNAVREVAGEIDFMGHTARGDFVIITTPDKSDEMARRCLARLKPAIQYFYPAFERLNQHELSESQRLTVEVSAYSSSSGDVPDLATLLALLESAAG